MSKSTLEDNVNKPETAAVSSTKPKYLIEHAGLNPTNPKETVKDLGYTRLKHVIENWPEPSKVWALNYSSYILGAVAGATGFYLNHMFRKPLFLGNSGLLFSYFCAIVVPTPIGWSLHEMVVKVPMMDREKQVSCPVCLQVKAGLIHMGFGAIQPAILSALFTLQTVSFLNKSFRMPNFATKPKQSFSFARQILKGSSTRISIVMALHMGLGMGLTYIEQYQYYNAVLPTLDLPPSGTLPQRYYMSRS